MLHDRIIFLLPLLLVLLQDAAAFILPFGEARYQHQRRYVMDARLEGSSSASASSEPLSSRKDVMKGAIVTAGLILGPASAAGIGAREANARSEPLGVLEGLLADCPTEKNCASSQDDRPGCWQVS